MSRVHAGPAYPFFLGDLADSIFRDNVDGTRIGESKIAVSRCLFASQSGKGFNSRASTNRVEGNWFRGNRNGVFLFEGDEASTFTGNLFTANDTPFRLGDFYEGTVNASGNEWDRPPTDFRPEGAANANLVWDEAPVPEAGPAGWPLLAPIWETAATGGFVDAGPAAGDFGVWAASWSGEVRRAGHLDGATLASVKLADVVDASPALGRIGGRELLAVASWDRKLTLLDGETLAILDRFEEAVSPADDHRQSAPVFSGGHLFAATWAGRVRGFDVGGGKLSPAWEFTAGGPFRAPLAVTGEGPEALLLAPCEDGTLYALSAADGRAVWRFEAGAPLLASAAAAGGRVYVPTKTGRLHALRASDGEKIWEAPLCGPAWYADPLVLDGRVFQGDDGGCFTAFDGTTGAMLWRAQLDGGIRARPAPVDDCLAVVTAAGSLYLLDGRDGFTRDRLAYPEPLLSSPAALGAFLFFGGRDGKLHAVDVRTAGSDGH